MIYGILKTMSVLAPKTLVSAKFTSPQINVGLENEDSENLKSQYASDTQVSQKTRALSQKMLNIQRVRKSIDLPKEATSDNTLYGLKINHPALQKMINYFVKGLDTGNSQRPLTDCSWRRFENKLELYFLGYKNIEETIRDLVIVDLEHEKFHLRQLQSPGFKKETEKIKNQLQAIQGGANVDLSQETLLRIMSFLSSRYENARSTQKTEVAEKLALLMEALNHKMHKFNGLQTDNLQHLPKDCYWGGFENKLDSYLSGASDIEKTMRALARVDLQHEIFNMRQHRGFKNAIQRRNFKKETKNMQSQLQAIRNGSSDAIPQETLFRIISFVFFQYYSAFSAKKTQTVEKLAPLLGALERKMYHFKWDDE